MGAFASPNRAGVMNSLPPGDRGAGGGMNATFQSSAQVLSIGIFFTLMIIGLSATLSTTMTAGLEAHGVPVAVAQHVGHLPPVSILFAAFLGYNPIQSLVGAHVLSQLSAANAAALTGRQFFPTLISGPFAAGLHQAFTFSLMVCLVAAVASWSRGGRFVAAHPTIARRRRRSEPVRLGPGGDPSPGAGVSSPRNARMRSGRDVELRWKGDEQDCADRDCGSSCHDRHRCERLGRCRERRRDR